MSFQKPLGPCPGLLHHQGHRPRRPAADRVPLVSVQQKQWAASAQPGAAAPSGRSSAGPPRFPAEAGLEEPRVSPCGVCPDPGGAALLGTQRGAEHGIQDPSEGTGWRFTRTSSTQNHFYYIKTHSYAGAELSSGLWLRTAARQVLDQAHERSPAQLTSARCRGSGAAFRRTLARSGRTRGPAVAEGEAGGGFDLRRVLLAAAAPAGAVAEAPHAGQGVIGGRGGEPAGRG